jgi:predicted Zn finger-like uncharacterized protein
MSYMITCPECRKQLQVPDNLLGQTVQCPECKHIFTAVAPHADDSDAKTSAAEPVASKIPEWNERSKSGDASKKKKRSDDDRDEDEDADVDIDEHRGRRYDQKPGKVTGLGVMALVGGIIGVLLALSSAAGSVGVCCLWPGTYYSLIMGIMAITRGSALLGANASQQTPPTGIAVMMIINIINADVVNCVLGIIMLVFCGDDEVKDYLAK